MSVIHKYPGSDDFENIVCPILPYITKINLDENADMII